MKRLKTFMRPLCSAFLLATLCSTAGAQQQSGTRDSLSKREVLLFAAQPPGEQYQLRLGDVLSVDVFQQPDLSSKAEVDVRGMISLPFIEDVEAADRTVDEVRSVIAFRYRKLLADPQVSVSLVDSGWAKVYAVHDTWGREVNVYTSKISADEVDLKWQVKSLGRDEFRVSFFSYSFGGREKYEVTALLDGSESLSLGWADVIRPTMATHHPPLIEFRLNVPLTALARIAQAREIKMKLGDKVIKVRENDLEALRFIVAHFSAPAP